MANISTSSIFYKQDNNSNSFIHEDSFKLPFTEQNLLALQEIFVTLGIHIIKVKNIIEGRQIIKTILDSLNYYHNIGCVTNVSNLPDNIHDIRSHIPLEQLQKGRALTGLEDFLTSYPYFDFIWIEFTKNIEKEFSYKAIKNIIDMYHIEEHMPILIVTYDEE